MERTSPADHLTDDALFALALPAAGLPEALPAHLSECLSCSRALADWKTAVRDLGEKDEEIVGRRTAEEWSAAEDWTLSAIRQAGAPGRGRARTLRWTVPVAASVLLFALLVPGRQEPARSLDSDEDTTGLSAQDRADDALLRDVDRLASGEETWGGWGALAPDPANVDTPPATGERS
jgi:hypothetical protein